MDDPRDAGWICLVQRGPDTFNVLVPEFVNNRLREVDARTGHLVRYLFEGSLAGPRAVAAGAGLIAVSESQYAEDRVTVFDAFTQDIVSVIGGTYGSADGQLNSTRGVCITADGLFVAVADSQNNRVSLFETATGRFVRHVISDIIQRPYHVIECEDGFIVACTVAHTLLHVTHAGEGEGGGGWGVSGLSLSGFCPSSHSTSIHEHRASLCTTKQAGEGTTL